jgi:hypothetical protein
MQIICDIDFHCGVGVLQKLSTFDHDGELGEK